MTSFQLRLTTAVQAFPQEGKCPLPTPELRSVFTVLSSAPWHTGREAQINSRTLTAVFSQVLGDLKTKEEVLNLFQTSSC